MALRPSGYRGIGCSTCLPFADDRHQLSNTPSQRDLRSPERMRVTSLAEPTSVGDAPLSADLLSSSKHRGTEDK